MPRSVIAGQEIKLRTRFKDDLNEPALASGVSLYIFVPDSDEPLNPADSYLTINNPFYLGEGIYEYGFNVPDDAEEGTWYDLWYGTLNSQLLSGQFEFEVYSAGEAEALSDQLYENNIVEVTLMSGIYATDGTYLGEEYSFEFLTTTSPSYTSIRKVNLEVGGYLTDVADFTIQLGILEASLEADQLSFATTQNEGFYEHARREWTTCKTAMILLDNITSHALRAKRLGDLQVEYDPATIVKTIARISECLQKWEPQLINGGYSLDAQQPVGVVKGEYDYDRPQVGRLWESMDSTMSDRVPGSNSKDTDYLSRRYKKIFSSKKRFW